MATSGIGGIGTDYNYGYNSGYNSGMNYDSWVNDANKKADELKEQYGSAGSTTGTSGTSGTKDTSSTSGNSSVKNKYGTATTSSAYLRNYQMALTDLEDSAAALQMSEKDNVFSKYEDALKKADEAAKTGDADLMKSAQENVEKAFGNIVSAVKTFAEDYNSTVSFLKNNNGMTATASSDLSSFQSYTLTDKALQTFGLSKDKDGYLSVDEKKLTETLEEGYDFVKETIGGQYGIAERVESKATRILDSSVDQILGNNKTSSADETDKKTSSAASTNKSSSNSNYTLPDGMTSFANFAKSGAYNLTNYYAVGMLLNTIG